MSRVLSLPFVAMLVLGCADVDTGDDTNPFGDGTTSAGTAHPTSGEASTAASGEATSEPTSGTPTTGAPTTAEASTSGPPPGTDDATTAPPGDGTSSGGGPMGTGELGECIGIGAWESCAQYCEAVLDVCIEAGCDGATVVTYGTVGDCNAMQGSPQATACDEPFSMAGGASFARCCCG